jgi:ABC-type uncharacterized transport system substrate-binding protein
MTGRFTHLSQKVCLLFGLALIAVFAAACDGDSTPLSQGGSDKPRVLIVHSYDNGFRWSAEQNDGIIEGLKRGGFDEDDYDLRVFYMDARVNFTTNELIALRADIAFKTIDEFMPQVVFLTDDTAVEEVAVPYIEEHPDTDIAFVFSNFNGDPLHLPIESVEAPGVNLTGTLERIPFTDGLDAARRVFPSASHAVIFADESPSSRTVMEAFRRSQTNDGAEYPLQVVDFIQIDTFEEWKDKVDEYREEADVIGVINYHRIKDASGNIVLPKEVIKWTLENSRIPMFGLISDWSADGVAMSFGNSGFDTGVFVGQRGAEVLNGADAGTMPIVDPHQYEMTFNTTTIEKEKINVPQDELNKAAETFR